MFCVYILPCVARNTRQLSIYKGKILLIDDREKSLPNFIYIVLSGLEILDQINLGTLFDEQREFIIICTT